MASDLGVRNAQLNAFFSSCECKSLADIESEFRVLFVSEAHRTQALQSLVHLLTNELVGLPQRIAAYHLLAFSYDWTRLENFPYLHFIAQAAGDDGVAPEERSFLQALLRNGPAALTAARPLELAERHRREPATLLSSDELHALYGVPGRLSRPPDSAPLHAPEESAEEGFPDAASGAPLGAPGMGAPPPPPPLMPEQPSELAWVPLSLADCLVWDDAGEVMPPVLEQMRRLLADAQLKPLAPAQQKRFLAALEAWPRLVQHIHVSPAQLPALVEHNNMLAVELLLKLLDLNSPRISAFLDVLVCMDLSVHSMEVVKRLTSVAALPTDFLHLYIKSCIQSCETIEQKNLQNRLVRLVCVFLQSLIRTKVLDVRAVQYELLSFCVHFSRIREAATLFRLLQNMQEQ